MKLLSDLRKELKSYQSLEGQKSAQRFFKEPIKTYGMKSKDMGTVSKKYFVYTKVLSKEEMIKLCEDLFKSDMFEEFMIGADLVQRRIGEFTSRDIVLFESWINKYINNWAKCDVFCNHSVGSLIEKNPKLINYLKKWSKSKNRWMRRASAVSLIVPARKGMFLDDIFEISATLLTDKEDMVQKGYGWLLKAASDKNQKKVFDFVIANKEVMPRTSLRYAIEKMPKELKISAMKK